MSLNFNYVPSLRRESAAAVAGVLSRPALSLGFMGDTLDSRLTFSRGTYATQYDSGGNLAFAPMNLIRNNTMVGAVGGTPGTLPTNWSITNTVTGLTTSVVGTGIAGDINFIDIRIQGTPSGAGASNIYFETTTGVPAVIGQIYNTGVYIRLISGTTAGISGCSVRLDERDATGSFLTAKAGSTFVPVADFLSSHRKSFAAQLTSATTAYALPYLATILTGAAVDITLRIGLPTLQLDVAVRAENTTIWLPVKTSSGVVHSSRSDFDPVTLQRKGTLIEETRTNGIRNNTALGAVAGTPGTLPTNWSFFLNGITGVSSTIVGVNQDKGVAYLEIRIFGTPSATVAQGIQISFEGNNIIAANASEVWSNSVWCRVVGGSTANISQFVLNTQQYNAGVFVTGNTTTFSPVSNPITRYSQTVTLTAATTTHVLPLIGLGTTAGQPIDITLRIGLPQLELGSHASSTIPTYNQATGVTRLFDNIDMSSITSWFNATEGTLYGETVLDRILPTSGAGAFPGIMHVADGTFNNRIVLTAYSPGSTNNYYGTVITGGVDQGSLGTNAYTAGTVVRGAYAYKANDAAFSANGSTAVVDNTVTLPTGLNIANFGGTLSAGANRLNGWLRNIKYYNTRLSNVNLQRLTG